MHGCIQCFCKEVARIMVRLLVALSLYFLAFFCFIVVLKPLLLFLYAFQ